jgi:ubiquinone biosynthesis protein
MFGLKKRFRDIRRFEHIIEIMLKYEMGYFLKKLRVHNNDQAEKELQPEILRRILEDLGGGFVKLGQLLSLRPDLIPQAYCIELSKLQDTVPPIGTQDVRKTIENELKEPIEKIFPHFNFKPIAAASIGQVHWAKLRNGTEVAIKVQRPMVKAILETDLEILEYFAQLIQKHMRQNVINPVWIIEEFKKFFEAELDYLREANNIENFYTCNKNTEIKSPKVFKEYCTEKVLVMEYIEGKEVKCFTEAPLAKKKHIFDDIINAVFRHIFIDGVFHADPHPGNILVMKRQRIAFIDFGVVGYLDERTRDRFGDLFIGMITKDIDAISRSMITLGLVNENINEQNLKEDLAGVFGFYYDTGINKIQMSRLIGEMLSIAKKDNITIPNNFVLLCKSIITLEGFALEFEPKFNIVESAQPFIKQLIKQKTSPRAIAKRLVMNANKMKDFVMDLPDTGRELAHKLKDGQERLSDIDKNIATMSREVIFVFNRILIGIIVAGLMISGALLVNFGRSSNYGVSIVSLFCFGAAGLLLVLLIMESFKKYN